MFITDLFNREYVHTFWPNQDTQIGALEKMYDKLVAADRKADSHSLENGIGNSGQAATGAK